MACSVASNVVRRVCYHLINSCSVSGFLTIAIRCVFLFCFIGSDVSDVSNVSDVSDVSDVSNVSDVSDVSNVSDVSDVLSIQ